MIRPLTAHQLAALRMIRVGAPTLYEIGDSLGLGGTRGNVVIRAKKVVAALVRRGLVSGLDGVPRSLVCTPAGEQRADAVVRELVLPVRCDRCNAVRFGVRGCPMCGKRARRAA